MFYDVYRVRENVINEKLLHTGYSDISDITRYYTDGGYEPLGLLPRSTRHMQSRRHQLCGKNTQYRPSVAKRETVTMFKTH